LPYPIPFQYSEVYIQSLRGRKYSTPKSTANLQLAVGQLPDTNGSRTEVNGQPPTLRRLHNWKSILKICPIIVPELSMHPSFTISGASLNEMDLSETALYADLAVDHCCLALFHIPQKSFVALEYYDLEKKDSEQKLSEIFNVSKLARAGSAKVVVVHNTPEVVMIPEKLFGQTNPSAALELIYGDLHHGKILDEKVEGWNLHNVYRVPAGLQDLIESKFTTGEYWHFYSLLLKQMEAIRQSHNGDELKVIFYPHRVVTALVKSGQLQMVQSFEYEIAEDVAYYLLNICQQFHCDPNTISVQFSGLVDTESPLYTEMVKYFLHVSSDNRSSQFSYVTEFDDYPLHFFTPVFSIASCA